MRAPKSLSRILRLNSLTTVSGQGSQLRREWTDQDLFLTGETQDFHCGSKLSTVVACARLQRMSVRTEEARAFFPSPMCMWSSNKRQKSSFHYSLCIPKMLILSSTWWALKKYCLSLEALLEQLLRRYVLDWHSGAGLGTYIFCSKWNH